MKPTTNQERTTIAAVSQTVAAEVLGMKSPGSLRALRHAPRRKDGRYDLRQLVPWYIDRQAALSADDRLMIGDDADGWSVEFRKTRTKLLQAELAVKLGALGSHAYYRELWLTATEALRRVVAKIGYLPRDLVARYEAALDDAERFIVDHFHLHIGCRAELHVWTPDAAEPLVVPLPSRRSHTDDHTTHTEAGREDEAGREHLGRTAVAKKRARVADLVPRPMQGPSEATQA